METFISKEYKMLSWSLAQIKQKSLAWELLNVKSSGSGSENAARNHLIYTSTGCFDGRFEAIGLTPTARI